MTGSLKCPTAPLLKFLPQFCRQLKLGFKVTRQRGINQKLILFKDNLHSFKSTALKISGKISLSYTL